MTTRADIRGRVRVELSDSGPNYVWVDALLNEYINEGLETLADVQRPQRELSLASVAGQRDYILGVSVGLEGVLEVQYPAGVILQKVTLRRSGKAR